MAKSVKVSIKWKRGRRADTDVAERMIYESHCGQYQIIRSKLNGYGVRWQAMRKQSWGWGLIEICRSRAVAEKRCENL